MPITQSPVADDQAIFTVGELAEHAGVTPQEVRNWEAWGFLAPAVRTPGGARRYTRVDREIAGVIPLLTKLRPTGMRYRLIRQTYAGDIAGLAAELEDQLAELNARRERHQHLIAAATRTPVRADGPPVKIGEAARELDISPWSIRHWIREGLIAPDGGGAYAYTFTPQDRQRLQVIALIQAGTLLTVKEIRGVLASLDQHDTTPLEAALERMLGDLDSRIAQRVALFSTLIRVAAEIRIRY